MTRLYYSVQWNDPRPEVHGVPTLVTDGGLRYMHEGVERSAWQGGYFGFKRVDDMRVERRHDRDGVAMERFRNVHQGRLMQAFGPGGWFDHDQPYCANLEPPAWPLNRATARLIEALILDVQLALARQNKPITFYPGAPHRRYWPIVRMAEARGFWSLLTAAREFSRWRADNEAVLQASATCDFVSVSCYRYYDDQSPAYIAGMVHEARRLCASKPVYVWLMPTHHDSHPQADQPLPISSFREDCRIAWDNGADGVVLWHKPHLAIDVRPYLEAAQKVLQ